MPADVRESYRRFPAWSQHFWTWSTGRALPHQRPLVRAAWSTYLAATAVTFFGGLALSSVALATMFPLWGLALAAGMLLTVNGARTMILVVAHQALHRRFTGDAARDRVLGELVTLLNVYADFGTFKDEHFDNHHRRSVFATEIDPPVQSLFALGFLPGMSRGALWRRAAVVFVSPVFYARGVAGRVRCNLGRPGWWRAGFLAWAGSWLSVPFWVPNGLWVLLLAFVVPVLLFPQLSALLDRLGEHAWLTPPDPGHGHRFYTVSATSARFCGARVPEAGLPVGVAVLRWTRWVAATLLYHLPSRLTVIVGDLPNHDFHHRYPSTPDWMVAAYARQADIDGGDHGPPYTEVWGMWSAVDRMFRSMSEAPADAAPVAG